MIEQYTIFSIDETRQQNKQASRSALSLKEINIDCVNGNDHDALEKAKAKWGITITSPFKGCELGIWYTTLNAWEYALENGDLLCLEDDAILTLGSNDLLIEYLKDSPKNMDFVSLFVPENQKHDYNYDISYNNGGVPFWPGQIRGESKFEFGHSYLSRAYQTYSNVTILYTQHGAKRLISRVRKTGINQPVDCWLYSNAHGGYLNGYALKPKYTNVVDYNWTWPTTIHNSDIIDMTDK